ncbi:unnamed protein product [Arabis nemorensis]|uniref:RING-type domain-containing protein n=1 Tax=Arabis nemorensis TaxID=586526 RepID=A0A565B6Q8_9BRAS|nr:unnamed protein product [Arabis nemorensis]
MTSRVARMRTLSREQRMTDINGRLSQAQQNRQVTQQVPVVTPQIAKNCSSGTRRGPVVVDVESGSTARSSRSRTRLHSARASVESDELNKPKKSKAVAPPVEEPKFNCPICMCPFTKETSTKCGHIFCNSCIKKAISCQAVCPTCRKKVASKDLIRIFLPSTR